MERDSSLLDDYVLSLTDAARPRVCFLPTASGDADHYVVRFLLVSGALFALAALAYVRSVRRRAVARERTRPSRPRTPPAR